jgi:hypothetical protein
MNVSVAAAVVYYRVDVTPERMLLVVGGRPALTARGLDLTTPVCMGEPQPECSYRDLQGCREGDRYWGDVRAGLVLLSGRARLAF